MAHRTSKNHPQEKERWPHLVDLDLPFIDGSRVTVLLGADTFDVIVPLEIHTGYATKTHVSSPDEDLRRQVKSWWELESFGCKFAKETPRSVEDKQALAILQSTTRKVGDRYQTSLFWKDPNPQLPNNRVVAEKQFYSLEKRLAHDPGLTRTYRDTISNDLEKGYCKKLSSKETSTPIKR